MVACDLRKRGYKIAIPYGEECDYDLVIDRDGNLERVQVKHADSHGEVIDVHCYSNSLTNGKIRTVKRYTLATIDWLAVYDRATDRCYYIPASELGSGRREMRLRIVPPRNRQQAGIRYAEDYVDLDDHPRGNLQMEPAGIEPATSCLQSRRSPN
jgi:PD-(D/E)XK endonuclease